VATITTALKLLRQGHRLEVTPLGDFIGNAPIRHSLTLELIEARYLTIDITSSTLARTRYILTQG
jgi:hypothetical protein